ncbi:branched-chain amino acid ABC transporter permease [Desulfitobacterium sp. AusDCA]|uniref:branched-chain amino acid ABC transporter permease n=1 Tax=Desulfitobacterium sp. AusDCA TaxID=3240383 RepID=UPI003DA75E8F
MIIQLIANGLAMGCIYTLVALGTILIYNATSAINFAQGEFVMLGAFLAIAFLGAWKLPFVSILLLVMLGMAIFGLIFERIAYYPLRKADPMTVIISTLGVSIFLKNAALIKWGAQPLFFGEPFKGKILKLGFVTLNPQHLLIIAVTVVLLIFLYIFFEKTSTGRVVLATSQDTEAAKLMGIKTSFVVMTIFMIGSVLGAVAGVLIAPVFFANTEMGYMVGMKAFAGAIIGGFGKIEGAIVGCLFIGLVEIFTATYISSVYKDAFSFLALIIILMLLPKGIFGEKVSEKV